MYHIFYNNEIKNQYKYFFLTKEGYSNKFTTIDNLKYSKINFYEGFEPYFETFELAKYYCYVDIKDFIEYRFFDKVQNLDELENKYPELFI